MTREHAKAIAPIVKAFGDGEDVQHLKEESGEWHSLMHALFEDQAHRYRIAPKPRKVWVNEYTQACERPNITLYFSKAEADNAAHESRIACYELELPPLP